MAIASTPAIGGQAAGVRAGDFASLEQRTLVLSLGLAPDRAWLSIIITADPRWA